MENEERNSKEGAANPPSSAGGGGWGFSSFSVLSDLQKAAGEISRTAVEAAKTAAREISELRIAESESDSESSAAEEGGKGKEVKEKEKEEGQEKEKEKEKQVEEGEEEEEGERKRREALDRLENASEDSLLGQGLKAFDSSVETFASGAWGALGSAWKGGTGLLQKLEESIQHGNLPAGDLAPSIVESGKMITARGMEVLERVGKETMELLLSETGLQVENAPSDAEKLLDEQFEEVTFDRCFYIYGGPDHLEELEALSNHYAMLFNRRKAKLSSEQKSFYDEKLRQVKKIFNLGAELEEDITESDKGKTVEAKENYDDNELKTLRDASVSRAAAMAAGFVAALGGLASKDVIQRTENRLEGIHSEGIHRLSEMCCFAVSHLVMLGKSVITTSNKPENEGEDDSVGIDWPEDSVSKAKMIRSRAEFMNRDVDVISKSFITGISDIMEAYTAALQGLSSAGSDNTQQKSSVQEKARAFSNLLSAGQRTAMEKIQDAIQYLAYVVLSSSMPTA